jgi:hypothetical protein
MRAQDGGRATSLENAMPTLPRTNDEPKSSTQMNLLDRPARAIAPPVATRPLHVIALFGLCAACLQGGLTKLFDFSAAVAETRSFGLPFAAVATGATIVTDSHFAGGANPNIGRRLLAIAAMLIGASVGALLTLYASVSAALAVAVALLVIDAMAGYCLPSSTAAWTAAK